MLCLVARFEDQVLRYPLPTAEAIVGSASASEIFLPFPGVSRRHARATRSGDGLLLTDLGSKNKLIVGRKRVDEVHFTSDMAVQLGRVFLTIEDASTSDVDIALRGFTRRDESDARDETDPVHLTHDRPWRTPALALRCIREIELAGDRRLRRDRQTFLALSEEALGSRAILILEITDTGDIALVATGGTLPEDGMIDALGRVVSSMKTGGAPTLQRLRGDSVMLCTCDSGDRRTALVAVFPGDERRFEAWEMDFFQFLARRLIAFEPVESTLPETGPENGLRIPEGMVVGDSPAIRGLLRQLHVTVHSRIDVLLWGETGTGKELYARMIHASGPTMDGPFVAINCAAIPSELLEAELFGVLGRVATGVDPRPGLFLDADGGTVFLDEIGELASTLQAKLLRVLQEREVLPLGATKPKKINVRVISASNSNLLERVERGAFRADLYYRLRGLQFHIPPLRERPEDIPEILLAFVNRAADRYGKRIEGVSRKALRVLTEHEWPGNVRELQGEVERAVLLCSKGGTLGADHFASVRWTVEQHSAGIAREGGRPGMIGSDRDTEPGIVPLPGPDALDAGSGSFVPLQKQIDAVERDAIGHALRVTHGNRTRAARLLGITRNGLAMKMKRLGIE